MRRGRLLARDGGRARQRFEGEREVVGGMKPRGRVLLQAVQHEPFERRRDVAVRLGEGGRVFPEDGRERVGRRLAAKGAAPRQHLVEHGAEREDVGAVIHLLPAHLLRRHVADSPHHRAGVCVHAPRRDLRLGLLPVPLRQLRQPEVQNLRAPVRSDEDVLGLEIAVHNSALVRGGEAARDLRCVVDGLTLRERRAPQLLAQRLAFEQLGDDEGRAVVLPNVVDGEDVRVVERAGGASLLLEACEALGVCRELRGQHFDRHVAPDLRVAREIDLAHPALAEQGADFVAAEAGVRGKNHARKSQNAASRLHKNLLSRCEKSTTSRLIAAIERHVYHRPAARPGSHPP